MYIVAKGFTNTIDMHPHNEIISSYINKYGKSIKEEDKLLLLHILQDPETQLSGDFFEAYNNKEALRLASDYIDNHEEERFEKRIESLLKLPYERDTKSVLHMTYGTHKCQFASIEEIWHLIKNYPHITEDITEKKPRDYYDSLKIRDEKLLHKAHDIHDNGFQYLLKERHEYILIRKLFFELIKPLRRTIGSDPFIALVKRGFIEDQIDEHYRSLIEGFNYALGHIQQGEMSMDQLRNIINKIQVYVKRANTSKLAQHEKKLGAKRTSEILDIIFLKKQLKTQNKIIHKYFNNSNISNVLVDFYERNYEELWDKSKALAYLIQQKEIFLWAILNGKLQLK